MPEEMFPDRPWGKGNNPKTAVWEDLHRLKKETRRASDGSPRVFQRDKNIENKLLITVAPDELFEANLEKLGVFEMSLLLELS